MEEDYLVSRLQESPISKRLQSQKKKEEKFEAVQEELIPDDYSVRETLNKLNEFYVHKGVENYITTSNTPVYILPVSNHVKIIARVESMTIFGSR